MEEQSNNSFKAKSGAKNNQPSNDFAKRQQTVTVRKKPKQHQNKTMLDPLFQTAERGGQSSWCWPFTHHTFQPTVSPANQQHLYREDKVSMETTVCTITLTSVREPTGQCWAKADTTVTSHNGITWTSQNPVVGCMRDADTTLNEWTSYFYWPCTNPMS